MGGRRQWVPKPLQRQQLEVGGHGWSLTESDCTPPPPPPHPQTFKHRPWGGGGSMKAERDMRGA